MKSVKETSLTECLIWTGVPKLPEKDDKENIWIKAIALVAKADGSESYVAMAKDDKLNDKIVKDFGNISLIHSIKEVYPYSYLLASYMPEFKTKKKEERINYLSKFYKNVDMSAMSVKELDKLVVSLAIKKQIEKEKLVNK